MSTVELNFPIVGGFLPSDNGYPLYAAVSRNLGRHLPADVSLSSVGGIRDRQGRIVLSRSSALRFRLPSHVIQDLLPLAGAALEVGGQSITLGVPHVELIRANPTLVSRLVTIKGYTEPEPFLNSANLLLRRLCGSGHLSIPMKANGYRSGSPQRRVLKIKGRAIVGFGLQVEGLLPEDSERLLVYGLGGRRHMGCGIFVRPPVEERSS